MRHYAPKTPGACSIFGSGENSIPLVLRPIQKSVRKRTRENVGTFLAPERLVYANNFILTLRKSLILWRKGWDSNPRKPFDLA
jgi:hypothetical protein